MPDTRSPADNIDELLPHLVSVKLQAHDLLGDDPAVITSWGITAHTATFDTDGSVIEHAAWIPSCDIDLDGQIALLERTLATLKAQRGR